MKLQWSPQELIDHWTLTDEEITLIQSISQTDYNRLGYALLLKYFQREGKFPQRKQDIPPVIVEYITQQSRIQASALDFYNWKGRTTKRHRVQVRQYLGVRTGTVADAMNIGAWLAAHILLQEERQFDRLKGIVYERYKELKIEPPEPKSIDRLIRSAVRNADEQFYTTTMEKLSSATREKLDGLLSVTNSLDGATTNVSVLYDLKSEAGVVGLESVLIEIAKLRHIRSLELPPNLFSKTSRKALSWFHQRIAVEDLHEVRRHPTEIRYTLLAAYCWQREQEITDTLIELLISLIHRIGTRAERTVDKQLLKEIKRVRGKNKLLYEVACASIKNPDETVRKVIFPIAGEQTLQDVVQEFTSGGSYEQKVQTIMRGSYSNHYRRMVPVILNILTFCSTNTALQPLLTALELIRTYVVKRII